MYLNGTHDDLYWKIVTIFLAPSYTLGSIGNNTFLYL